jgi:hypothetical protein
MVLMHFSPGAADPLTDFDATGARFVPLAAGQGTSHVSCLHLNSGASVPSRSVDHAAALLCVHGRLTVTTHQFKIDILAGMGGMFDRDEPYTIESATGAIVIIVETDRFTAHERGISSPERIAGARWPGDSVLT